MLSFESYIQLLNEAEPIPAEPAQPVARRRKYARRFSADKTSYLDFKKDGTPYWRKKSAQNIVFFGKQQDHDAHDK